MITNETFAYQYWFYFKSIKRPDNLEIARVRTTNSNSDSGKGYMLRHYDRRRRTNYFRAHPKGREAE